MGQYRDGVHPTNAAYDRLGQAVHDLMVEQGMRR
jgi:lysophospholipase L1-like esterase